MQTTSKNMLNCYTLLLSTTQPNILNIHVCLTMAEMLTGLLQVTFFDE